MKTKLFILSALAATLIACGDISPELEQFAGKENGYDYVDLGLSVTWAPINIGATAIGEYGDLFAWGEIETKDYFDPQEYKWGYYISQKLFYNKYCINPSDGVVDNLTTLEPEDDAAHVLWGGTWRMPTEEEWKELRDNCTWKYSWENGVKGKKATGPNGNSIFFPLAGAQHWDERVSKNITGYYRSATLGPEYNGTTYIVIIDSEDSKETTTGWSYGSRVFGMSVRPVCVPVGK